MSPPRDGCINGLSDPRDRSNIFTVVKALDHGVILESLRRLNYPRPKMAEAEIAAVVAQKQHQPDEKAAVEPQSQPEDTTTTSTSTSTNPPQHPPGTWGFTLLFSSLCLTTFMWALDTSIITTALPRITDRFNSSSDVGFYGSAYYLTSMIFQPVFGRILKYFDTKKFFMIAISIFEAGSIICATAISSNMFIAGRAIAGVGAAGCGSCGMFILTVSTPMDKRAFYLAIATGMFGISGVLGPVLGGVLTQRVGWPWCFWINLPIGAVASALIMVLFKPIHLPEMKLPLMQKLKNLDLVGSTLFFGAMVPLLLALEWGGSAKSWGDGAVWGCMLTFGVLISLFAFTQWRLQEAALTPPRIYRTREVLVGGLMLTLLQTAFNT